MCLFFFSVMQDCQSCGHDSDLKSHPASAEPAQTFINGSEHTLKCEDDKEVCVNASSYMYPHCLRKHLKLKTMCN